MLTYKEGAARCLLLGVVASAITGCSAFVTNTDKEIVEREAKDQYKFLVSKLNRIKACVVETGGICKREEDAARLPMFTADERQAKAAWDARERAQEEFL